jgi:hypothetical protein
MSIALNTGFANNPNDTLGRKAVSAKNTVSPFRDYLASTGATAPEKPSPVIGSVSSKTAEFDPFDAVRSSHVSEPSDFAQAMRGMSQGSITTGVSDTKYDTLASKDGVMKEMALPFWDSFTVLAANSVEKINQVSTSTADIAAEFDPFSVVRSGAVPEDNAFVMALKRFYGMVVDPAPLPQIPSAVTLGTTPVQIENVQASQASMVSPPTTDHSPDPLTGLSQLIANAVEQSAATTANQEVIDSVLNRLS